MPILHALMLFTIFSQLHFFLKLNNDIAKFLSLFQRAMSDIVSFIVIEMVLFILMATVMQVMGVRFDDGDNMNLDEKNGYDTMHNDYPLIWSYGVSYLSIFRCAVGDL